MYFQEKIGFLETFKIRDSKDCFFFLWDTYTSLKSSSTPSTTLPNHSIKIDAELLPYCNILDRYHLQLCIHESWSWALLESYSFMKGRLIEVHYISTLGLWFISFGTGYYFTVLISFILLQVLSTYSIWLAAVLLLTLMLQLWTRRQWLLGFFCCCWRSSFQGWPPSIKTSTYWICCPRFWPTYFSPFLVTYFLNAYVTCSCVPR